MIAAASNPGSEVSWSRMQEGPSDHLEVEWQFDADDLGAVEGWLAKNRSAFGITASPVSARKLSDTYYDTEDWRFYRAGYVLRVRRTGERAEATMKALSPPEDGVRRRREISEPLEGGDVQALRRARGPVGERLRLLAGATELRPLFELRTRRRVFELRTGEETIGAAEGSSGEVVEGPTGDIRRKENETVSVREVVVDALGDIHRSGAGPPAGEVTLDESEVFANGKADRLSRVEVEVGPGEGRDEVEEFANGLRESLGLRPSGRSKFGMGLDVADMTPVTAPDLGSAEVEASMSVGEVAFAVLRRHFASMLAHEPGVRLGEDPEELHDMRVATRRLRATLKLYAKSLPKRAERFERDLKWVANSLGDVRDLDVHLDHLAEEAARREEEALGSVSAVLEKRREEARRRMMETLDSARYERLISNFTGTLRRGRSPAPTPPLLEAAPNLVGRRYEKVRKRSKGLTAESPAEDYHELRKKGKRLRYAIEPLQDIYGKPARKMVDNLKDLQDDLGGLQDLIVFSGLMKELASAGGLAPQTIFSMGVMSERYAREASKRRESLPRSRALRDLRKRWKVLRKAMEVRNRKKAGG
jgi:triphosphatase